MCYAMRNVNPAGVALPLPQAANRSTLQTPALSARNHSRALTRMCKSQDAAKAVAGEVSLAAAALAARGGAVLIVPPAQRLDGAAQHDHLRRQGGERNALLLLVGGWHHGVVPRLDRAWVAGRAPSRSMVWRGIHVHRRSEAAANAAHKGSESCLASCVCVHPLARKAAGCCPSLLDCRPSQKGCGSGGGCVCSLGCGVLGCHASGQGPRVVKPVGTQAGYHQQGRPLPPLEDGDTLDGRGAKQLVAHPREVYVHPSGRPSHRS